jgi:hypothetical protein
MSPFETFAIIVGLLTIVSLYKAATWQPKRHTFRKQSK